MTLSRTAAFAAVFFVAATSLATAAEALPPPNGIAFWTPAQQRVGYRAMEKIFHTNTVRHGGTVFPLTYAAEPLTLTYDYQGKPWTLDDYIQRTNVAGLLIIKDGKVLTERYGLGQTAKDRWTSFSVGKSITSTLVGAAIEDGSIAGLDAQVTTYLPALKGSGYDGVTVRQLLTMSSGVKWTEDYKDPNSDVNRFEYSPPPPDGSDPIVAYMGKLPREAPPGVKFAYKTGESDLVGDLVIAATHKSLSDYLSEKIWAKFGMEEDAVWMLDRGGQEFGGCCISMTLRDYGRFALFVLNGGMAGGERIVPANWFAQATRTQVDTGIGFMNYGFQWWTHADGSFEALGIFGQSIYINPAEHLIIVTSSAWPNAGDQAGFFAHAAFTAAVVKATHK